LKEGLKSSVLHGAQHLEVVNQSDAFKNERRKYSPRSSEKRFSSFIVIRNKRSNVWNYNQSETWRWYWGI